MSETTFKMATANDVMDMFSYAFYRWTLMRALVGLLLLLMPITGSLSSSELTLSREMLPNNIGTSVHNSDNSIVIDATSVTKHSTMSNDVIMTAETLVTQSQTLNQSSIFKDFSKSELIQSSSVSLEFSENSATKENRLNNKDSSSTQRIARSINSKTATSQVLENSASTSNKKDNQLESSVKNIDLDWNEVDSNLGGKAREYYRQIQPTKTISVQQDDLARIVKTTSMDGIVDEYEHSGEEYGAPRGRSLPLTEPETPMVSVDGTKKMNASQMTGEESTQREIETPVLPSATFRSNSNERKTNPDIQDIITGIVKLLNGNVKVQANPNLPPGGLMGAGRPLRPLSTRINNRGPPRITDVPSFPLDFETVGPSSGMSHHHHHPPILPLQTSTRVPPPYPFDRPPAIVPLPPQPSENNHPSDHPFMSGIPLPEQVVPVPGSNNGNRPSGGQGRPHRPRPHRPRPPGHPMGNKRRPQPIPTHDIGQMIPPYKPGINKKPQPEDIKVAITVMEDQYQNNQEHPHTTTPIPITVQEEDEVVTALITANPQTTPVELPSSETEDEDVPITTEDIREEVPNKENVKKEPNLSETQILMDDSPSLEGPKIIATLTSSSSTVNEATQEALPVSPHSSEVKDVASDDPTSELPILLEPSIGVGIATPILESSMHEILLHESTSSSEWDSHHGAVTSTQTPTSVLPSSMPSLSADTSSGGNSATTTSNQDMSPETSGGQGSFPYDPYQPRPGIVLDDTEYKPGGVNRPIITAPPFAGGHVGDIFDVTVTAIQGPGGGSTGQPFVYPVEIEGVQLPGASGGEVSVITKAEEGQHFVSIDGKRTYINLFGSSSEQAPVVPTRVQHTMPTQQTASTIGTGYVIPQREEPSPRPGAGRPHRPPLRRPYVKRPNQPPVRIDTCIVGDDSTCDSAQNEMCRTEAGVSSCHCRPGYSRRKHREPCRRVVSILMSLRVDRLYDRRVVWDGNLQNPDSEEYKTLEWESSRAIDSAMSMTPFSDDFMGVRVNGLYTTSGGSEPGGIKRGAVFVNLTLQLEESVETLRSAVRHDIQRHLLGVIHRRNNNVGDSALWVDSPPGSVSHLQDVDECSSRELHDCHHDAHCSNVFGSFRCSCPEGYRDPWVGNPHRSGRQCETCSPEHCSSRGECRYEAGQPVCYCSSNFYGSQCEVDGEVLGVAVGASVAAVVIIVLTLVCLCMWSRRWSREQKTAAGMGSPVFGYMTTGGGSTVKTPAVGSPPYQVSLEDRLRWAQIADVMVQANHYAPEPVPGPTRPSSAMFGYPSLTMSGTLPHGAPPVPLPRLGLANMNHTGPMSVHGGPVLSTHGALSSHGPLSSHGMRTPDRTVESTSSEEEDRADLLGRNFHVPRPKSRSSVANQSGIYYDVDYEQGDMYGGTSKNQHTAIPLSTYTMSSRAPYFRQ